MVQINNSDLSKELIQGAKIQVNRETPPNQLADKVVPVMEVNPKLLRRAMILSNGTSATTSSGSVLLAIPTGREVWITGLSISNIQDANCDNILFYIDIKDENGTFRRLYSKQKFTLTATNMSENIQFSYPIRAYSVVALGCSFTVGTSNTTYSILGYYVDNPNA